MHVVGHPTICGSQRGSRKVRAPSLNASIGELTSRDGGVAGFCARALGLTTLSLSADDAPGADVALSLKRGDVELQREQSRIVVPVPRGSQHRAAHPLVACITNA